MEVDFVHLKKLSPADCAHCIKKRLCFRCCKKGHSANECRSAQTQGRSKGNSHPQQVRTTEISLSTAATTATIAPITPINAYIQNLTTKGRTTEDILQTLKVCYEDPGENVATTTTFSDNESF